MASVSAAASARSGSPSLSSPAPAKSATSIGSPNITTARLRVSTVLSNAIPIGTITTSGAVPSAPSAMRAAPDFTRSSWARSPVVPSGKMATVARWASSRWQASNTEALSVARSPSPVRYTGRTPASHRNGRATTTFQSAAFARNRGRRPSTPATTTGSTKPLPWFATINTGRSRGSRSRQRTSTDRWNASTIPRAARPSVRSVKRRNNRGACCGSAAAYARSTQARARTAVSRCQIPCVWSHESASHTGESGVPSAHAASATPPSPTSGPDQTAVIARRRAIREATTMTPTVTAAATFVAPGANAHAAAETARPIARPISDPASVRSRNRPTCQPATKASTPISGTSWRNWLTSLAAPWYSRLPNPSAMAIPARP
jgi:hypothetical protein